MSSPWNKVSLVKHEPKLLDIMSEELCNRLQIEEDFVWVNLPEVNANPNTASPDLMKPKEKWSVHIETIGKVAQSTEIDITEKVCQEDISFFDSDREFLEPDYMDQFENLGKKPVNLKMRYSSQWMKPEEHGTDRIYSSAKNRKLTEKTNKQLPKMKFDAFTTAVLEKLISDRYLGQYNDVVGTGKNSVVCHADCNRRACIIMPFCNAVKVYKIGSNEERNKTILKRVQREFHHLEILWKHRKVNGTFVENSPWARRAMENVIVMRFIGYNRTAYPSIQNLPFDKDNDMYINIVEFMDRCYNVMHLVHGKLSTKKILSTSTIPWFVGWSHSVKTDHPQALTKLMRDCRFVTEFYKKRGVAVKSTEELFKQITGVSRISSKLLEIMNDKDLYEKYDSNPNRIANSVKPNSNLRFK